MLECLETLGTCWGIEICCKIFSLAFVVQVLLLQDVSLSILTSSLGSSSDIKIINTCLNLNYRQQNKIEIILDWNNDHLRMLFVLNWN